MNGRFSSENQPDRKKRFKVVNDLGGYLRRRLARDGKKGDQRNIDDIVDNMIDKATSEDNVSIQAAKLLFEKAYDNQVNQSFVGGRGLEQYDLTKLNEDELQTFLALLEKCAIG